MYNFYQQFTVRIGINIVDQLRTARLPGRETPGYSGKFNGTDGNKIPFRLNEKTFSFTCFLKMLEIYLGFHVHEGYG